MTRPNLARVMSPKPARFSLLMGRFERCTRCGHTIEWETVAGVRVFRVRPRDGARVFSRRCGCGDVPHIEAP